ncbi:hypothetical protein IW140_002164 [Coemansia sp. RSA 1813]|nr:hypothetical protein EV178_001313 [Coemansia sp. RSA 1646]KAJ1770238.1 hypothetical protein LPJ74_003383 [Coemansia sp. RSA 1843]KAJ2090195.1 hypothetical protein IW138_002827 [Coemansia sp. RSA 986]KAJ2214601.1 hypothetical protein EV179_002860 [Coemansia sp. RSA 487]KAJ2570738.1 hypothetical protein IW140_002164 [Coemansia sp. RSA 1813]
MAFVRILQLGLGLTLLLLLVCSRQAVASRSISVTSGGLCDPTVRQHSGYMDVGAGTHLFYWFFESRSSKSQAQTTPVVLWLNGGPGCSSLAGLFGGVGPCWVNANGNDTTRNEHSWNADAHLLFVDQPANTGYSYGPRNATTTTAQAARDVVSLLGQFYRKFPEYLGSELYVAGESYAAQYVPAVAARLVAANSKGAQRSGSEWLLPRLAGIAVGNGLFDMAFQYRYLYPMACQSPAYPVSLDAGACLEMLRASADFYQKTLTHWRVRTKATAVNATYAGFGILAAYQQAGRNPYDVRTPCQPSTTKLCDTYMDRIAAYASRPGIRAALGTTAGGDYALCDHDVQMSFIESGDEFLNTASSTWLPEVLDAGIRVLVYAGDADLICNWMGIKELILRLPWYGGPGFAAAPDTPWTVSGAGGTLMAGSARSFGGLSLLRIYGAGHMVAKDKPLAAQAMFRQWISHSRSF